MQSSFLAFVVLAVSGFAEALNYTRTASLSGQSFLDAFSWESIPDPTHGRVNYISQADAEADGLYSVDGDTVTLRADNTTVLSPSGPGRNSFRLMSNKKYTNHAAIFDIAHMPEGCGTWPAVFGDDWPNGGEIDIVEGVNNQIANQATLHTSPNCTMPSSRLMNGTALLDNCDVYATGNRGCGVRFADKNSFGPDFNQNGGGWYVVVRTSTYIAVHFWERGSDSVPRGVQNPGDTIDISVLGTPAALFPNTDCDFSAYLSAMNIIINLTFGGDWAGAAYSSDQCPSTCVDYVNNNPGAFSDAYFKFNALNIYE